MENPSYADGGFISGLAIALLAWSAAPALALPQFSIRSARACDTCHVDPKGWTDPEVAFRKCSLNCNVCHVSPSGGGMRNESGIFYGRVTLPMFGKMPVEQLHMAANFDDATPSPEGMMPSSQPMVSTSQPAVPTSQPAAPASQPTAAASQPAVPTSQPAAPASQPTATASQPNTPSSQMTQPKKYNLVPAPGTAGRYAGIEPHPDFQIGGDLRLALFVPLDDDRETSFFPMQTDVYFAVRPYNPSELNKGRLTLLASVGSMGSRAQEFDGFEDRFFVREWYAMYHDLPYQAYVRAGRFLPAHGWKTDDHTGFVRQGQLLMGAPFDHERQVTGLEVGMNPNYPYVHVSVFNAADQWDKPIDANGGNGMAISGGYRDLGWHGGSSVVYGNRGGVSETGGFDQLVYSFQAGLNFFYLADLPLIYMGEYHFNHMFPEEGRETLGLAAFHEIGWLLTEGLNSTFRYDWSDSDTELRYDSRHRFQFGFEWYPWQFVELIARYRHNWTNYEDRFEVDSDEVLLMVHAWY